MNKENNNKTKFKCYFKSNFKTKFFTHLLQVFEWLSICFPDRLPGISVARPFLLHLDGILHHRGSHGLVIYVKRVRTQFLNYLSGNLGTAVVGIDVTHDGLPTSLRDLIPKIREVSSRVSKEKRSNASYCFAVHQLIITILLVTRSLRTQKEPDLEPITGPRIGVLPSIGEYVNDFWKELGYSRKSRTVPNSVRWKSFHFSTKSGPNGHALWAWQSDLESLTPEMELSLCTLGGKKFTEKFNTLKEGISKGLVPKLYSLKEGKVPKSRRLAYFPDREDKVRVVAILDYFTQSVLKRLHSWENRLLKKIPQDMTFSQGSFKDDLDFLNMDDVFISADLSAATDRFPIDIIKEVLKGRFPDHYIDSWADILVGYPFEISLGSKNKILEYKTGNPMGAYSSWPSFAIAHHYIVYYCCRKLGLDWRKTQYKLLGDDIVLKGEELGNLYIQTISSLGVTVSPLKTHRSCKFFEFAKRYFYYGHEITHFPISALQEEGKKYYKLTNLLMEIESKGWVSVCGIPNSVRQYYKIVKRQRVKLLAHYERYSTLTWLMLKYTKGSGSAEDIITEIFRRNGLPIAPWEESESRRFISRLFRDEFMWSDPSTVKSSKPLGLLAESLVMHFTSFESDFELGFALIQSHPILNTWGRIEELWLEMKREEKILTSFLPEQWPFVMRKYTLPQDDTVFSMRTRDLKVFSTVVISQKLEKRVVKAVLQAIALVSF